MSTSSEVFTARINTPVHISLTMLPSSTSQQPPTCLRRNSDNASTTFSRLESCPAIHPTFSSSVNHQKSLAPIIPPSASSSSVGGQFSTSKIASNLRRWRGDVGFHFKLDTGVFVDAADQLVPPRLPDYEPPPPPYNPDFLAPRGSDVGRPWSSTSACCPPPPPPSRQSSTTAVVRSRSSLPLIAEQCVMDDDHDVDDDDVFFVEKPTTLVRERETRS